MMGGDERQRQSQRQRTKTVRVRDKDRELDRQRQRHLHNKECYLNLCSMYELETEKKDIICDMPTQKFCKPNFCLIFQ